MFWNEGWGGGEEVGIVRMSEIFTQCTECHASIPAFLGWTPAMGGGLDSKMAALIFLCNNNFMQLSFLCTLYLVTDILTLYLILVVFDIILYDKYVIENLLKINSLTITTIAHLLMIKLLEHIFYVYATPLPSMR